MPFWNTSSVSVGDLNGDGSPDIVVAFGVSGTITWFSNTDGLGVFSAGGDIATDASGASWVTAADIDGDGDLDVASASFYDGTFAGDIGC